MDDSPVPSDLLIRTLPGLSDYPSLMEQMRVFTETRDSTRRDELWFVQHPSVFTQGQSGRDEHLLMPNAEPVIPVIRSNRGGQITYHGPGQIVVYLMLDLRRRGYGIRSLVTRIENALIDTLAIYRITAYSDPLAPGVYVDLDGGRHKIASLGLRVSRGCSYHGLSLNTDMDLAPFSRINPCGYSDLKVTQVRDLGGPEIERVQKDLALQLSRHVMAPSI